MPRYARLFLGLVALAAIYWQLGGFGSLSLSSFHGPVGGTDPGDTVTAELDSGLSALDGMGGPDDGLQSSAILTAQGFERMRHIDPDDPLQVAVGSAWETLTIGRNESFYVALQRAGLEHFTIMGLVKAASQHTDLRKVRRGDVFQLSRDASTGAVKGLRFDIDAEHYLVVRPHHEGEGYEAVLLDHPVQRVVKAAQGEIRTNLFDALRGAGASIVLADQLAEVLGWDIDFFRDLRQGDRFVVVYAEYEHEGVSVRDPEVLAVHFENRGREIRAYRGENEFGLPAYYKADGSSLERQFLRAPLKFTRISSGFSHKRLHPVLKRNRPHYGVDYVAATGTPVMATADATVIKRSRDGASGNFVGLRHGNGYETYYLHLSRFASGINVGTRVKQGQVIGYVGNTGWSTGPHLDYRIKKNGMWINPQKLALPPAAPVRDDYREAFARLVSEFDEMVAAVPGDRPTLVLDRTAAHSGSEAPAMHTASNTSARSDGSAVSEMSATTDEITR